MENSKAFPALKILIDEQKFALGVNLARANTPGSPGHRGYENFLAMWGTFAAIVFTFIGYGWLIGLLSVPVGIAVFLIAGRVVQKRAASRTRRWALSSASRFLALWEIGDISVKDTQSGKTAISSRGDDLEEFVRAAVTEVLVAESDPVSQKLNAAFHGYELES